MLNEELIEKVRVRSWDGIMSWFYKNVHSEEQWIFRGQCNSRWGLETSLERSIKSFIPDMDTPQLELGLLRRFKRQSHHYITDAPKESNDMEWLALMRHYGAPTRLLDWTYSFFVALYFAVAPSKKEGAIWAVKNELLVNTVHTILPDDASEALKNDRNATQRETFDKVFRQGISLVCPIKPYRFNDRLIMQQGAFLCPGDICQPFEDNLTAVLSQPNVSSKITKIIIADNLDLRKKILKNLHHMNMNAATLFPGLAGFAQSLETLLAFPDILKR